MSRPLLTVAMMMLPLCAFGAAARAYAGSVSILERAEQLLQPTDATISPEPPASETPAAPSEQPTPTTPTPETRFGRAGSWWWSIGPGIASDFSESTDTNIHGSVSAFLADDLEFGVEAAGWYFNQQGPDTGGVSASMIFRWHFAHDDDYRWTMFADAGIGLLAGFDDVPDGGTTLNLLPRLGGGFTHVLGDDPDSPRLTLGVRWHHISNARIEGDEHNPARDAILGYFEIQFPF